MNNKIAAAVMALLMSAGLAATARAAATMLDSAQTLVNGKPYQKGQVLQGSDQLTFNGPGFVKINGITFDFTGTATAAYENGVLQFSSAGSASDSITVTDASGNKNTYTGASASGLTVRITAPGRTTTSRERKKVVSEQHLEPDIIRYITNWEYVDVTNIIPAQGVTIQVSPSAP